MGQRTVDAKPLELRTMRMSFRNQELDVDNRVYEQPSGRVNGKLPRITTAVHNRFETTGWGFGAIRILRPKMFKYFPASPP